MKLKKNFLLWNLLFSACVLLVGLVAVASEIAASNATLEFASNDLGIRIIEGISIPKGANILVPKEVRTVIITCTDLKSTKLSDKLTEIREMPREYAISFGCDSEHFQMGIHDTGEILWMTTLDEKSQYIMENKDSNTASFTVYAIPQKKYFSEEMTKLLKNNWFIFIVLFMNLLALLGNLESKKVEPTNSSVKE